MPEGQIFDAKGSSCFASKTEVVKALLGLTNSCVSSEFFKILSPTVDYSAGSIAKLPVAPGCFSDSRIIDIVDDCIDVSKRDWDSFEISWDFQRHPLIPNYPKGLNNRYRVEELYYLWTDKCENRFMQLKANEEELNRLFIDIYELQDELSLKVEDNDVTVQKANMQQDIKSLISYAVGCMFGRYSLDVSGLIYAGGDWDDNKYRSFIPDPDNCIPITDEEYFQDDIVGRFVEFVRTVYGADTLEENLEFISSALGNSGKTARDTIRQYFLKDFFKDHCSTYSASGSGRRPIYWLFDSGKQNGFKALVYMHRWNADTVGNLRVEYLHRMQTIYEKEIENCQDAIDNSLNNREVAAASKRKEKLIKQIKECKEYDAKVAHIALSRIDIDLDDGVKVNYRKVQTGTDGKFCEILADSKSIMAKEK